MSDPSPEGFITVVGHKGKWYVTWTQAGNADDIPEAGFMRRFRGSIYTAYRVAEKFVCEYGWEVVDWRVELFPGRLDFGRRAGQEK